MFDASYCSSSASKCCTIRRADPGSCRQVVQVQAKAMAMRGHAHVHGHGARVDVDVRLPNPDEFEPGSRLHFPALCVSLSPH